MKKRFLLTILVLVTMCGVNTSSVNASFVGEVTPPTSPPAVLTASPVIITATSVSASGPLFVQLYNNSDVIQDLHQWKLSFVASDTSNENEVDLQLVTFDAWVQPRGYIVVSAEGAVSGADYTYTLAPELGAQLATLPVRLFQLTAPAEKMYQKAKMASNEASSSWLERYRPTGGKYTETLTPKFGNAMLTGWGAYLPPEDTAGLQIVEILANARDCSPLETALDCGDYVKVYNSGPEPVDLGVYRLRTDSGGSKSSSTNTVKLNGLLMPGTYTTIHLRDNGDSLSITNDGGYVWLEDMYGVETYSPIVAYPDATYKQGQSWAYDPSTLTWRLMVPAPDVQNYWPPIIIETTAVVVSSTTTDAVSLADCGEGRERNPETNRCRTIVTATSSSTLASCAVGQERNPETNRCRSVLAASTTLAACSEGQERNPETNRCRSVLTAASIKLAACPVGQERNPATNRCRKITDMAANPATFVKDVESVENASTTNWLIAVGAVCAALAYGIWEWRSEIRRKLQVLFKHNS